MRLQRRLYGSCIVPSWHSGLLADKNCFFLSLRHLVNYQNTQLNTEAKNQASNRHILEFCVVCTVSSFVSNPVYS